MVRKPELRNEVPRAWHLTPERRIRVLKALASGASDKGACDYAGISTRTFRWWMEWGNPDVHTDEEREEFEGWHSTPGYQLQDYQLFWESVTMTKGTVEVTVAAQLLHQGYRDYRADVEWLSRQRPDEWAAPATRILQEAKVTHDFTALAESVRSKLFPEHTAGGEGEALQLLDGQGAGEP
jgi:hypothetical protein